MVEDKVGEEAAVLVAAGRIVRNVESILLEVLPEQLGGQRMVLGSISGATIGTLEGPSNRIT
jgi:hypothetical protein